jgi:hypothetical protein
VLANRVAVGPVAPRQILVDDDDGKRSVLIRIGEGAALQERNAHGFEVVEVDRVGDGADGLRFPVLLLSLNEDAPRRARPEWHVRGPADCRDSRRSRNAVRDVATEVFEADGIVAHLFGIDHEDDEVLIVEARIDGIGALHGAKEERGCNQRDQGERHLSGEQGFLESRAAACESGNMGFFLKAGNQAGLRSAQRGHDTEDEPGGEGEEQGEEEHGAIEFGIDEIARHLGRPEGPSIVNTASVGGLLAFPTAAHT